MSTSVFFIYGVKTTNAFPLSSLEKEVKELQNFSNITLVWKIFHSQLPWIGLFWERLLLVYSFWYCSIELKSHFYYICMFLCYKIAVCWCMDGLFDLIKKRSTLIQLWNQEAFVPLWRLVLSVFGTIQPQIKYRFTHLLNRFDIFYGAMWIPWHLKSTSMHVLMFSAGISLQVQNIPQYGHGA